ncbi:MAG TPA: ABC transporter ATP-binding protein [Pseudolysinimonas sp.]|nr:ABC transporter ATP-binding protein [Pseudolysinimonas sp.]
MSTVSSVAPSAAVSGAAVSGASGQTAGPLAESEVAPAIRLSGVGKRYEATAAPVLENVTLDIQPGEFVCLLGASGCGKSTLLNLIAGLDKPTTGSIRLEGDAGMMFQESALLPWLSASRNVELALRLRGVPRRERRERALELLDTVNLADAAKKRPHELSGGMRQRVALARALAQDRSVLLMDEPFAALDAITRDLLHEELEQVWRATGRTIVFVTHNVREAARLGQRVLLMSSRPGRIAREWQIEDTGPRRIESPEVSALAIEITEHLRREIRRNAA